MALCGCWYLYNLSEKRDSDALDWRRLQDAASKGSQEAKQQLIGIRVVFDALRAHNLEFSDDQIALKHRSTVAARQKFLGWLSKSLDTVPLERLASHADISSEDAELWHAKVHAFAAVRLCAQCCQTEALQAAQAIAIQCSVCTIAQLRTQ